MLLQSVKTFTAARSQLMPCTSCASASPHSMRYRLLSCGCKAVAPFAKCQWRGKMVTCLESNAVTLYMTRENSTPLRILHAMTRKFEKTLQELPELRKVQNTVNHYRRTKLGRSDRYGALSSHVATAA
ncbi:hypothetical protein GQ600_22319 [Phytophthora cactorum]|nr:hypothetical protein GQ600_22319 [Phytophthora cactorum]